MPEDTQVEAAQNTSDGDGKNTGATEAGETHSSRSQTEAESSTTADAKTFTQAELDKFAQKVRLEEKRKFEKQLKDAALSESERQAKELETLRKEIRLRDARDVIRDAAKKAGATNPEAVYLLGQRVVEFDEDKVSNVRDVLDYAREKAPELFPKRPGSGNGGEGQVGSFGQSMNDLIRRSAGRQ